MLEVQSKSDPDLTTPARYSAFLYVIISGLPEIKKINNNHTKMGV